MHGLPGSAVNSGKIISFEDAPGVFGRLRGEGRRIVQCHGTFDLVHPGHIVHLEEAARLGDVLVVTVTGEKHVNKGPGRPYFNDALRARTLSALSCVSYVVLIPFPAAVEAIEAVRPHVYCKGTDYLQPSGDVTGNFRDDVATVTRLGGEVRFIGDVVFSSTRLLNSRFQVTSPELARFCDGLATRYSPDELLGWVGGLEGLRVLVVGEAIFDRYTFVQVQGLTSKNRIISGRYLEEETHPGGALAIYRHVRQFVRQVRLVSLVGTEPWVDPLLRPVLGEAGDACIRDGSITTIIKQRYVEPVSEGKDLSKLFAINYLDSRPPSEEVLGALLGRLRSELKSCDVVILADFGHGMMQEAVRDLVQDSGVFLAVNCQTNSNNRGFNVLAHRYRRADVFSLDEQELLLCCGSRHANLRDELERLRARLGARRAWLTRGAVETLGLDDAGAAVTCPPLRDDATDTVGAGDAFFSLVALAAARGMPLDLATLLGQLAGSQAVKIVGNREPISKSVLLKGGMTLLNRDLP